MFWRKNKSATDKSLPLAERVRKAPRLSAPKTAKKAVAELLASSERATANSLRRLFEQKPIRQMIEGIADGSPFLWGLIREDPPRFAELLNSNPERHLARLIARRTQSARAAQDPETVARDLRLMKREAALLIALTDIGGVWSFAEVARALTWVAEAAVQAAANFLLSKAHAAGQLRLPKPDVPGEGSGFIVLGMGKLGGELNYSSDIDLIILFNPKAPLAEGVEPSPLFVKLTRDFVRLLQERTSDGYVFRVDLRLRPDPGSTQVAIGTDAALAYYERSGQTWERAVFIKARSIAGDIVAGENFLRDLAPFVWRRYLDHAAIAEIQAMKRQIHAFRGHGEIAVEGHNIKLGRGGIREIEFFVQTQQLIAGGRASELRGRKTLAVLDALAAGGWIDAKACDELAAAYVFLREVEHRLQMVADEQTHSLPQDPDALVRFARFFGCRGRADFAALLEGHLGHVQSHYSHLFEDAPRHAPEASRLVFPPDKDDRDTLDTLAAMGFRDPVAASALVRDWLAGRYRSLKPEAARADLAAIAPSLLADIARSGDPDAALIACDRFFSELPGSERLLAALRTHPDLVRLLSLILGTAPRLGDIVARSPSLLDGLLDPGFFGASPSEETLTARLDASLSAAENEEQLFDRARRFGREQMVLIGVRILSGVLSAGQAGEAYATLADVVIRALHREVERIFSATYRRMRGAATAVLALCKH